jgi:general secretion pathway protein G
MTPFHKHGLSYCTVENTGPLVLTNCTARRKLDFMASLQSSMFTPPFSFISAHPQRQRARGFTLIEVMVVIVILGVLAALVVPRVIGRPDEAKVVAAKQDIAQIMQALKLFRLDNQRYPTTEQGLQALVTRPTSGPAPANWKATLEKMPVDPWGKPYQFLNPGIRGEVDVFSLGADGAPGGTGVDADIGSWSL